MDHPRYRNVENIKDETLKALTIGFIDLIQDNKIYGSDVCRRLVFEHIEKGSVTFSLKVEKDMCNIYSTFHGGAYGYLADHISTLAIMSGDKEHRAGVSVQLGTSYMKAIPMNENVKIVSNVLRTGKQLATAEVRFYDKDNVLCAVSTHTKFLQMPMPKL
jgi:uncharacterized protein (TIGR00369 family)